MATPRRRGREVALQILCAIDANPELDAHHAIGLHFQHFSGQEGDGEDAAKAESLDRPFTEALVRAVQASRQDLDDQLGRVSRNWRIERMARVERNVLRMALYELLHMPDIPARVTINEAIELAKRFGTAEAPAFVNGMLDAALKALDLRK